MTNRDSAPVAGDRLSVGQMAFMLVILALGGGALAWSCVRMLQPPPPRVDLAKEALAYLRYRKPAPLSEPLQELLADANAYLVETQPHPLLGKKAPPLALFDHNGQRVRLESLLERGPVVLVFYLGYSCNHCVAQLFALNEDLPRFGELGATIVAVSPDEASTTRERYEQYGAFHFPVVSDPEFVAADAYGVRQPATATSAEQLYHGTFVIGRDGVVHWAEIWDEPFTNNRTLLYELARLEGRLPSQVNAQSIPGREAPSASR